MNAKCFLLYVAIACLLIMPAACEASAPAEATLTATATATPPAVTLPEVSEVAPQIIAQSPLKGQRLSLLPVIEIVFDRDMDTQATTAAWSFYDAQGEAVTGNISWEGKRTFRFTPTARLDPDSRYWGVFSTSAAAVDGTRLSKSIRLDFRTVSALAVGEVFPANGAMDVDPNTSITVVFNRPVVPVLLTEDQSDLPQPLQFSPPVSGHGKWVNSSMYIFQPDHVLDSGTTYIAQIAAGLKDASGSILEADYAWLFTVRPVTGYVAAGYSENVLLDYVVNVYFAQPMDADSVAAALAVVDRESGYTVPVSLEWSAGFTRLDVKPVNRYRIGRFYQLTIADTARSQSGGRLVEPIVFDFSTLPLPRIEGTDAATSADQEYFSPYLNIWFSSPMNLDSLELEHLERRVKITPPLPDKLRGYYDDSGRRLSICCLEAGVHYVVRILPGMADIYGNTINQEYSFSFKTADLDSYARLLLPGTPLVYRAEGPQEVFFEYTNLDSAEIALYPLSFDEFRSLMKGDVGREDFQPQQAAIRRWQPDVLGTRNRLVRLRLDFKDEEGNALAPGYYFLGLNASPFDYDSLFLQGDVFIVATDSITFKTTSREALAWLVELETGQPVADIPLVFYDAQFNELGRASTDKNGLAYVSGLEKAWYARTEHEGRTAFASLDWGSGVSTGQFGLWWNYYTDESDYFVYLYTDRPLYRPGQEVHFMGMVRLNDDLHYRLPLQRQYYVKIQRYGEQVYAADVTLSDGGSFSGSFSLAEDAMLGNYDIFVYSSRTSDTPFGSISFRVAEYHKPEFQVQAAASAADVLVGDEFLVDIQADYYSGGTVANANVSWYMEASPYYFQAAPEYAQYSFTDWDRDEYWSDPQPRTPAILTQGKGVTDENGHLTVVQTASLGTNKTSRRVMFHAEVTDLAGNLVAAHTDLVIHQSTVYAGIRSEEYIGVQNQKQTFQLVALDWDSKPVANQRLSVEIVERRWYSVQEQDEQGQVRWVTSVEDVPVAQFTDIFTNEEGKASVSFIPKKGGIYKATVRVQDSKARQHRASAYLWVAGSDYVPWRQTNDRGFDLIADRASYSPGDTAELLIAQPFEGEVYALVTVERGHIYRREVIRLENNSTIYKLPITSEMAPVMYVSVVVVRGTVGDDAPDFKIGIARLNVATDQQALNVTIRTDKPSAGPGDQVTYTIETRDFNNQPVSAEISLALVDKAVLALAPDNSLPIVGAFYPVRSLSVLTTVGIIASADDFNANYTEIPPEGDRSGGGGGKGAGDEGIIDVRQEFRDTAYFRAHVQTNAQGIAQVTVTLPENLTTWRMDVRAATTDSRVGQATHELVSAKPLFIQLQTPRFFVAGDQARIGALVFNNSDHDLDVKVSLKGQGVRLLSDANISVAVKARQQAYLTWDVRVGARAKRVDLTATAVSGENTDSSKPPLGTLPDQGIPVHAFHLTETVGTSGLLSRADSATEVIYLPRAIPYEDASVSVELSPSLAASILDGLTYLEDYPYLCLEQTVSRFLPNVVARRVIGLSGQADTVLQSRLDEQVNSALQKIYTRQNYDGGWGWWSYESDPLTSAYVLFGLIEAREAGYEISEKVLNGGVEYLKQNIPNLSDESPAWEYNRQAFMAYVLARAGELQVGKVISLYGHHDRLALYGKAYLAQAMFLQYPQDSRLPTLLADLEAAAISSAAGVHWEESEEDPWNWNTDLRTTAIVLNALLQIEPQHPLTVNAVRWLMAHRSANRWGSTQENAWTLIALSNWLVVSQEFHSNYSYVVGINGTLLQEGQVSEENLAETVKLQIGLQQLRADEANSLVIARGEGAGNLYYAAYLDAVVPVSSVKPSDQGILVSRQYFTLGDEKKPVTQVKRGEVVRVRLTVIAPQALHYVLVTDPLPAGLEAIDSSLLTDIQIPSLYTYQDFEQRGWGWWYFDHVELRDEKVVLSADYLPAGTYVFTYYARASTVGTFNVIPPTAEEFYFPDVAGHGAGETFLVVP